MTLPVTIPNQFANATSSIPLSQLDSNFNTLSNVINQINAGTQQLANANVAVLIVDAGTSAAPTITTTGDTNTGIFFPAADTIAFAEGGAEAMRINSSGNVGIGTTSPASKLTVSGDIHVLSTNYLNFTNTAQQTYVRAPASNTLAFGTDSTERMRITSGGEVLVGGTTAIESAPSLSIQGTNAAGALSLFRNDTTVVSGNNFGLINFYGNDTTSNTPTLHAYIYAQASGTHAAGDNPTDLVFGTTPIGSATVAEVVRFTQDKYLRMASGTGGIQFGGDTAAANALDDYEEGTWTPVIADASTGGNASVTTPTSATYTKIGNLVNVQCFFTNVSTVGLTAGNDIFIRGFPFTALSVAGTTFVPGSIIVQEVTFSGYVTPYITDNNTFGRIAENTSGANADFILVSEFVSGATDFFMSLTYQAA